MAAGAVKLQRVAQDGVRVRASAGIASFRRERSLQNDWLVAAHILSTRLAKKIISLSPPLEFALSALRGFESLSVHPFDAASRH